MAHCHWPALLENIVLTYCSWRKDKNSKYSFYWSVSAMHTNVNLKHPKLSQAEQNPFLCFSCQYCPHRGRQSNTSLWWAHTTVAINCLSFLFHTNLPVTAPILPTHESQNVTSNEQQCSSWSTRDTVDAKALSKPDQRSRSQRRLDWKAPTREARQPCSEGATEAQLHGPLRPFFCSLVVRNRTQQGLCSHKCCSLFWEGVYIHSKTPHHIWRGQDDQGKEAQNVSPPHSALTQPYRRDRCSGRVYCVGP